MKIRSQANHGLFEDTCLESGLIRLQLRRRHRNFDRQLGDMILRKILLSVFILLPLLWFRIADANTISGSFGMFLNRPLRTLSLGMCLRHRQTLHFK